MTALSIHVPPDGKIIIARNRKPNRDPAQLDCFADYKGRWMAAMIDLIRSLPRPIAMSAVRSSAEAKAVGAPVSKNWFGVAMKNAGLKKSGYQISPLQSRRGGVEAVWA
ncbi:MAG: hypothetical protein WC734_05995 [Patescibacteria group bacterium]